MLLSNNKKDFYNLIHEVYKNTDILPAYIEKDFYAISILKELISRNDLFVFKGGTCLSVCHRVINRFSEDIDISYQKETIAVGERKRIKSIFFESLESILPIGNAENIRSRRIFNRYICPYKSLWSDKDDRVIVEWAAQTPAFPVEEKTAQTIIGRYLASINRQDLIEEYELQEFKVNVITKERTFVDKIFAICDYHISKKLERQSRHIYDLHKLLPLIKLDDQLLELFKMVRQYRIGLDACYSAKEGQAVSSLLNEIIKENTFKNDFNERTAPLLYDGVTYNSCVSSLKTIQEFFKNSGL